MEFKEYIYSGIEIIDAALAKVGKPPLLTNPDVTIDNLSDETILMVKIERTNRNHVPFKIDIQLMGITIIPFRMDEMIFYDRKTFVISRNEIIADIAGMLCARVMAINCNGVYKKVTFIDRHDKAHKTLTFRMGLHFKRNCRETYFLPIYDELETGPKRLE